MKLWVAFFVVTTFICWGAYVPTIHHGQGGFGAERGPLRGFLFVGLAYFVIALIALAVLYFGKGRIEPWEFGRKGVTLSLLAGVLGALGALGIIYALKCGGSPLVVAPLVFAGAPIVNTFVTMAWDKPAKPPQPLFYVGIVIAAIGMAMVLYFKPGPGKAHAASAKTAASIVQVAPAENGGGAES